MASGSQEKMPIGPHSTMRIVKQHNNYVLCTFTRKQRFLIVIVESEFSFGKRNLEDEVFIRWSSLVSWKGNCSVSSGKQLVLQVESEQVAISQVACV